MDGNKELVLDVNELAKDLDYFNVASINPSSDNLLVAYAEDLSGRREYNIKVKDLTSGKIIDSTIQEVQAVLYGIKKILLSTMPKKIQ